MNNEVHSQLAAQKIVFPATQRRGQGAAPADAAAMRQYAGQLMTNGAQAQVYADHFIAVHLARSAGGKTYSQLSAKALANPEDTTLAGQVETVFKGTTLRGMLLERVRRSGRWARSR